MTDHLHVARGLEEIAVLLGLAGENVFKVRAYERAARVVADLGDQLAVRLEDGTLTKIDGIGDKLADHILQLATTGVSSLLDRLRAQVPPGTVELSRVPGMTIKRILALHDALGITSVEQLRAACLAGQVRAVPGFGAKTEAKLLQAVEQAAEPKAEPTAMLNVEARLLADRIASALSAAIGGSVQVSGALRRQEETVSEIELVVGTADVERAWQEVLCMPWVLSVDRAASIARLSQGIAMLLHVVPEASAVIEQVRATGPEAHVEGLRARARERKLELDALTNVNDEAALYRALGLPWVPPELRGSRDDFDAQGYDDLIEPSDIVGMVHCHTTYSDGRNSIEEMARAADALGMQYLTITDHSPAAHYAGGVTIDRMKAQWDEIEEVQQSVRVRLLRGTESDILADGALDYPDELLERLDVVIASIHMRHKQDRARMTERLTRAMGLPIFKIWGHALGRILLSRDPIDCDVPAVLDALAASRGAIEINADPHRLDLPPQWIPHARDRGLRFVISVDAHSTQGLGVLPIGVAMARRGGLRKREVLNTLPVDDFMARVRPR